MREKAKCEKALARVEIFGMSEQSLIVAGADAYPPRKLRRPRGRYFFYGDCLRIVNDSMSMKADFERDLEVLDDRPVLGTEQRAPYCQHRAVASERAIQAALQYLHGRLILPVKTLSALLGTRSSDANFFPADRADAGVGEVPCQTANR